MSEQEARYDWKCARCGLGPVPHSTADSTCLWEPMPAEEARGDGREVLEILREMRAESGRHSAHEVAALDLAIDALARKHPEPEITEAHEARYDGDPRCADCGEVITLRYVATPSAHWVHRMSVEGEAR